jgi:hypothetical protein
MRDIRMAYSEIVCWINRREKSQFKKVQEYLNLKNIPVYFAKNQKDFEERLKKDCLPVISLVKARCGYQKLVRLVRNYPDNIFYMFYRIEGTTTFKEMDILGEKNVMGGQKTSASILQSFVSENALVI